MKKRITFLSVLTAAALGSTLLSFSVSAVGDTDQPKVRLVIENNTLSAENGADWTGTLLDEWVDIDESSTAKELFLTVLENHEYTQQGAEFDYITEINGLSAEDGGTMGGWMICLDDWITDEGLSAYTVSSGKLEEPIWAMTGQAVTRAYQRSPSMPASYHRHLRRRPSTMYWSCRKGQTVSPYSPR